MLAGISGEKHIPRFFRSLNRWELKKVKNTRKVVFPFEDKQG
jgi:hypothetical protein